MSKQIELISDGQGAFPNTLTSITNFSTVLSRKFGRPQVPLPFLNVKTNGAYFRRPGGLSQYFEFRKELFYSVVKKIRTLTGPLAVFFNVKTNGAYFRRPGGLSQYFDFRNELFYSVVKKIWTPRDSLAVFWMSKRKELISDGLGAFPNTFTSITNFSTVWSRKFGCPEVPLQYYRLMKLISDVHGAFRNTLTSLANFSTVWSRKFGRPEVPLQYYRLMELISDVHGYV